MGDTDQSFAFTMSLTKDGSTYSDDLAYSKNGGNSQSLAASNGVYTFNLKDGDKIALTLPYGCMYSVSEASLEYDVTINGKKVSDAKAEGTLTEDTILKYVNTKDVIIPTGLTRTSLPYLIIGEIVLIAVMFLIIRHRRGFRR